MSDKVKPFPLRLPADLFQEIEALARRERRSINSQVIHLLERQILDYGGEREQRWQRPSS